MSLQLISLGQMLDSLGKERTIDILNTFKSIPDHQTGKVNDVEYFLHNKAIQFEKMTLSTTHLVFASYRDEMVLVGYFSLANKPLTMSKKNYNKLSNSQKKRLFKSGAVTDDGLYQVNSYLLGQLGKNYSEKALATKAIDGKQLLTMAYDTILRAKRLINARYVWLECKDDPRLIKFYEEFGFGSIRHYHSGNDLRVLIMKLEND